MDSSKIEQYFKGMGCSFEQKRDELKISRFVNGGNFSVLGVNSIFLLFVLLGLICFILGATFGEQFCIIAAIVVAI